MPGICIFTNINNTIIVGESSLGGKKKGGTVVTSDWEILCAILCPNLLLNIHKVRDPRSTVTPPPTKVC